MIRRACRLRRVAALAALALMSACGTTVQLPTTATTNTAPADEGLGGPGVIEAPPTGAQPTQSVGPNSVVTGTSGPSLGISTGPAGEPASGERGASATPSGTAHSGRATAAPVRIGVPIINDFSALSTFGASLANTGSSDEAERMDSAIIRYLNARGGLAGHKIVPVYYKDNYLTGGSWATTEQAMCQFFTSDHHVFAVVMQVNSQSTLLPSCFAHAHTVMVDGTNSTYLDDQTAAQFAPYYYRPDELSLSDYGSYIDDLVKRGFLTSHDRIGLLRYNTPRQANVDNKVIRPALARHGLHLASEFAYNSLSSAVDLSSAATASLSAVLKFRSQRIDRIILMASQGPIPFTFMPVAQTQGFHPEYAVTSSDLPNFVASNAPKQQMGGAVGVGWNRSEDIPSRSWNDVPAWKLCGTIAGKLGLPKATWAYTCDQFFFLHDALEHARSVTAAALRQGADALGSGFQSASAPATNFSAGKTMGISSVRELTFESRCNCFLYTSGPIAIR